MFDDLNIYASVEKLGTKLQEWLDALVMNLPNFVLAVLVFFLFIILAKYLGKLLERLLRNQIKQISIRVITIKVLKGVIILIGFFVALGL